ncbi:Leucine Rich Repeat [Seminavis robusta]|uniref:Leucine Rich Repeat n=1 Tax=Seminavis robusta TaxID=568900 RepID=A0A9N8DFY0_9STRA|nr:Leucine Rich Repeat [Seminavis robusta]|eukprot:Sro106_g053520.1 Leucine Rich Repeat (1403) ;mRNA; f:39842-44881
MDSKKTSSKFSRTNRGAVERPTSRDTRGRKTNDATAKAKSGTKTETVSVMEAVSRFDSTGYKAKAKANQAAVKRSAKSQEALMSALGVDAQATTSLAAAASRRDRSSSSRPGRSTSIEDRKQSIREARARSRSRTRPTPNDGESLAPSTSNYSKISSMSSITEKTKTSRRPASGREVSKRNTQQLIMLRHAARCPYGPDSKDKETRGRCPIHKQCAEMKELLGHMTMCQLTSGSCPFPNCNESKGLLDVVYPYGPPAPSSSLMAAVKKEGVTSKQQNSSAPLVRSSQDEEFPPATMSNDDDLISKKDSPRAARLEKFPAVQSANEVVDSSASKPLTAYMKDRISSPPEESSKTPTAAEDIEMGVTKQEQPQETVEEEELIDDSLEEQSLFELEQQSLLAKEIQARRLQRAPKVKHKVASGSAKSSRSNKSGISSNSSTTSASTTASEMIRNSQIVAREIKLKAESMMSKMAKESDDGLASIGGSSVRRWARRTKFACFGFGVTVVLCVIALIFLYFFGRDSWDSLSGHFLETNFTSIDDQASESIIDDTGSPSHQLEATPAPLYTENDVDNDAPTMAPTLFQSLLPQFTLEALAADQTNESPQFKAYQWVLSDQAFLADRLNSGVVAAATTSGGDATPSFTEEGWKNRFALATLFYATSNKPTTRYGRSAQNWTHSNNWLSMGVSECEWSFYGCERGDSIWITNNGLRGTLPAEMGMLTKLRDLAIINNPSLTGPLPRQFGLLQKTVSVNLQGNKFSGEIPVEIGNMQKLRWLYLNNNKLTSSIPVELGQLSRLAYLWLNDNRLTGKLDPAMFKLQDFKHLQELLLHKNRLSGPLPEEIGLMPKVRFMSLHQNGFTGTIPTTIGLLTELEILKLHDTELTGRVPQEVCLLMQRGILTTLTIDCSKVVCDCGCSCTNDKNEQSQSTPAPVTSAAENVSTSAPTTRPTRAPSTAAPISTGAPTRNPTRVPTGQTTALPTASPKQDDELEEQDTPAPATVTTPPTGTTEESGNYDVPVVAAEFMLQLPDFTKEALLDPDTPQSMALEWLQTNPDLGQYSFQRKLQRYAMATIFYSTNGTDWFENDDWLDPGVHECDWFTSYTSGDICSSDTGEDGDRYLTDLMLWQNNLVGPLPPEVTLLTSVEKIFLGVNNITSLPSEIAFLSNSLRVLNMMHCSVGSALPSELGGLTKLKKLDLSENYFAGQIPSELGLLQLENLYLNHNFLAGPLPTELFNIVTAKGFNVAANALSGTLPTEAGKLAHLHWFNLYGNWMEGPVPTEIGLLNKMAALHASHNMFSGTLPSELGQLSTSQSLSIDVRYNNITGTVPSELGSLTNLVVLALEGNPDLTGEMPGEICELVSDWKLSTLSLDCQNVKCSDNACLGTDAEHGVCLCPEAVPFNDDGMP